MRYNRSIRIDDITVSRFTDNDVFNLFGYPMAVDIGSQHTDQIFIAIINRQGKRNKQSVTACFIAIGNADKIFTGNSFYKPWIGCIVFCRTVDIMLSSR